LTKTLSELSAWPTSGTDVYFTVGNVGVGTSDPNYELHVYDSSGSAVQKIESDGGEATLILDTSGNSSDGQIIIQEDGSEVVRLWWDASASKFHIYNNDDLAGTDQLVLDANGNVGIWTASPLYKLDVDGTADVTNLRVDNGYIYAEGNGNVWLGDNIATDNFIFNINQGIWTSAGNFGIGTTTPAQKLDVVGSAQISNDLYLTDGKSIIVDKSDGNSGVFLGNYGDGKAFCYANDNAGACSGTKYSAGVFVEGSVKASEFCIGDNDCKLSWGEIAGNLWTDDGDYLYANNANNVVVTDLGNVGIGTTAPGYKLEVNGDTLLTGSSAYLRIRRTGFNNWAVGPTSSGLQFYDETGAKIALYLQQNSGNVGIGTTSPSAKLEIYDNSQTANTPMLKLVAYDKDSLVNRTHYLGYSTSNARELEINSNRGVDIVIIGNASSTEGFFRIFKDNTSSPSNELFHVNYDGNVGIGTTSPNEKLEIVAGSGTIARIQITDTDANENAELQLQYGTNANEHWALYNNQTDDSFNIWSYNGGSSGRRMTILQNGRVGIGSTNPGCNLDVAGSICFSGDCKSSWGAAAGNLWTDAGSYVYANNASSVVVSDTGNIGIGSTVPTQKLEVNGNIKLSPANPVIYSGSSYITIPNGLYVSGGTGYFQNTLMARNGIQNDQSADSGNVMIKDNLMVDGAVYVDNATNYLAYPTGNYGSIQINGGGKSGWEGYSIDGRYVLMSDDNNTVGLYNDYDNRWIMIQERNSYLRFYEPDSSNIAMTINTAGNVGIGTTSPNNKLQVYSPTERAVLSLETGGTGKAAGMWLSVPGSTWSILNQESTGDLIFHQGNYDRMVITTSGTTEKVGINTINPSYTLDVNGDIRSE